MWYGQPVDHTKPRRCPIDLEIHNITNGRPKSLFLTSFDRVDDNAGVSIIIQSDPVDKARRLTSKNDSAAFDLELVAKTK